jgi:hypothetical protein
MGQTASLGKRSGMVRDGHSNARAMAGLLNKKMKRRLPAGSIFVATFD